MQRWRVQSRPQLLVVVMAVMSLIAAGCGDSDNSDGNTATPDTAPAATDASESDSAQSEQPSGSESESDDLGDFPIPAPAGGDVSSVQSDTSRLITYPASDRASIIEFYEQWIAQGDWAEGTNPDMVTIGDQFSFAVGASETEFYQVIATPSGDNIDVALVILR